MAQDMVQVIDAESFSAFFNVSRETMAALQTYEMLLLKWQKSINLVSNATLPELWCRHMLDSAQLNGLAEGSVRHWVDLGSGGGFPGLVIAILRANEPEFQMHLVESDQRKCIFMREVVRQTGVNAVIHTARIEKFVTEFAKIPDVVSARALAPLERLFDWSAPLFGPATTGLFLKGQGLSDELISAQKDWIFKSDVIPSRSDPSGSILRVGGLHAADRV